MDDSAEDANDPNRYQIPIQETLSDGEVYSSIEDYCDDKCCYRKMSLKHLKITNTTMKYVYVYELETFFEKRETLWKAEPAKITFTANMYSGKTEDEPDPWAIELFPGLPFQKNVHKVEIPGTSEIRLCHKCTGSGRVRCSSCCGNTSVRPNFQLATILPETG